MRKMVRVLVPVLSLLTVGWLVGEFLIARPNGLRIERVSSPPAAASLHRTDFWTAIRDLDLDSAAALDKSEDQTRFVRALDLVVQGDRAAAVREFSAPATLR